MLLECFISENESTGVMIPIPQYPLYSATISEYGLHQVILTASCYVFFPSRLLIMG